MIGHAQAARCGIQRVKQTIVCRDACIRELIEQRGFACVRVADQRNNRDGIFQPALALHAAHAAHLVQLRAQARNALADVTAVRLEFGLAGAARADAAAETGHGLAHAGKPRQQILILRQLHLQPALGRLGTLGKNIENEGAAIQNRRLCQLLKRTDLRGRKVIIEHDQRRAGILHKLAHLLGLALANEAVRVGRVAVLQHLGLAEAASRFQQRFQLVQRGLRRRFLRLEAIGVQADKDRLLRGDTIVWNHRILLP